MRLKNLLCQTAELAEKKSIVEDKHTLSHTPRQPVWCEKTGAGRQGITHTDTVCTHTHIYIQPERHRGETGAQTSCQREGREGVSKGGNRGKERRLRKIESERKEARPSWR